jgi:hypothetical protein
MVKKGNIPWNRGLTKETDERVKKYSEKRKGMIFSKKHTMNMSIAFKGRIPWNKGLKGIMPIPWNKGKIYSVGIRKPYRITPLRKIIFKSNKYRQWRNTIFNRDDYTCKNCGTIGKYLEADHIIPWSIHPELVFDLNNGQTLCHSCHRDKIKEDMKIIKRNIIDQQKIRTILEELV